MTFRILAIRHGVTAWNKDRRFQGHTDVPLDADGEEQARALGRHLSAQGFEPGVLVASDLSRAFRTAELVAEALGSPPPLPHPGWRERALGVLEGESRADARNHHPTIFQSWEGDAVDYQPEGGESYRQLRERVAGALDDLRARHAPGPVTLVTHGGCLFAALSICEGGMVPEDTGVRFLNTSLTDLVWTEAEGWRLGERLAATPHLSD